jgi:hypothetical protein
MWRRPTQSILLTLFVIATLHPATPPVTAKEFTIEGTVDCGKQTGKLCIPVGRKIGVLTESISGQRQRVIVDISWMLDRPVRRHGRRQELATEGNQVSRALMFTAFRDKIDALDDEGIPTDRLTPDDARALVRELVTDYVEVNADVIRDNLAFIVTYLRQDAPVTISVTNEQGPTLLAVMFHDGFDFSTNTSEGTLNTGALTQSDPDKDFCFDFVNEGLDFARELLEEQGNLELNDVEEQFFDVLDDLPDPCIGYYDNVEAIIADRVTRLLNARRTSLQNRLRTFLEVHPAAQVLLHFRRFIFTTVLKKPRPSERLREIERGLTSSR